MRNLGIRKFGVMALCCVLATSSMPRIAPGVTRLTEAAQSILDWQNRLEGMKQAKTNVEPFVSLRYDAQQGILYRDGTPVGSRYGEYAVVNGQVMLSAQAAGTGEAAEDYVPLEKAVAAIGCEVTEDETGVTITSPFESACLIVRSAADVDPLGAIDCVAGYEDLYILQYATPADAYTAYQIYLEDDRIDSVEPSRTVSVTAQDVAPANSDVSSGDNTDWGISAIGADTYNAWLASEFDTLPEVTVAVIDTGIYAEHERFVNRLAGAGVAFLDDNNYSVNDEHGHGTHCAGIIAAATTENVKILPVRVLDEGGYGSILSIYCGMIYALEQGVDVVSMSLGIDAESPLVLDAADQLYEAGILCCVASGNESMPAAYISPAQNENCITVGALDSSLEIASFSNYGPEIDFAAPGVDVLSAGIETPNGYVTMSGTSMATPYVAAACAMVLSGDGSLTSTEVYDYLKANADDLGDAGFDEYFGYGMVQMADFYFSADRCEMPYADLESGSYDESLTVSLSCNTEDVVIYYTLDGSMPTAENGILYEAPIVIEASAVLSAVAYKGEMPSNILVERYIINGLDIEDALVIENGVLVAYHGVLSALDLTAETFTAVGDNAFVRQTQLEEVLLPETVTSIGSSAFEGCTALWNFEAPGVVSVGDRAFCGDTELNWCDTAPLTSVGVSAFENCQNLYSCNFSESLTTIPDRMFKGTYFSGMLNLPNVTVIGDYAFANCYDIEFTDMDWTAITHIGDYAFEGCYLNSYDIALNSIESIGRYAFCETLIRSLTLSDQITVIPEGLLLNTHMLEYFSAPAVTEIDPYGLSTNVSDVDNHLETVMDFERITRLGEGAFCGYYFDSDVQFSALTGIDPFAFSETSGGALSFPALTSVPQEAFAFCENAALYFENAKAVEYSAIAYVSCPVVFSEACTEFDERAIYDCPLIAAPADSAVAQYAQKNDFAFMETPCIYSETSEYTFTAMDKQFIQAVGLGFDLSYQWYNADDIPILGATDRCYSPTVAEGETTVYTLVISDAAGNAIDSMDFTVTVEPIEISDTLTADAPPAIFDHVSLQEEYDENVEDAWNAFKLYQHYNFTPEADGTYYFYAAANSDNPFPSLHDVSYVEYDAGSYKYISAELKAGETYLLTLTFVTDDFAGAVGVTTEHPDATYNDLYYCYWDVEDPWETLIPDSYPYEPHPALFDYANDVTLVEGVDYQLVYVNNDGPGTMTVYAVGLGAYIGRSDLLTLNLAAEIHLDQSVLVDIGQNGGSAINILFIPETSGEYHIYTAYPMHLLSENGENTIVDLSDCDPVISIYDQDETVDERCDDYEGYYYESTMLSALTVTLEAGVEYTLECDAYGEAPYEVIVTQTLQNFLDCNMEMDYTLTNASAVSESVTLTNPDGSLLTEGEDYVLYTTVDDDYIYVVADGIGAYFGSLRDSVYLGMGSETLTVPENYVEIMPSENFTLDPTAEAYYMEITEEGDYGLITDAFNDVYEDIIFYRHDAETNTMEYYAYCYNTYTAWLAEGAYFIFIPEAYYEISDTFCFMLKTPIFDADVTIEDMHYTGEELYPTVTVTLNGETLVEDVDYILTGDIGAIQCGTYYIFVEGIGKYSGSIECSYRILPDFDSIAGTLTDGLNTVSVNEAGASYLYKWVPEQNAQYCFASYDLEDVIVFVMDENGDTFCNVSGYDVAYDFGSFRAGETYYVMVRYNALDMTGDIALTIQTGMTDFANCMVVVDQPLYYTGELQSPAVTVYDGDDLLTEGVDYNVIRYAANCEVGEGVVCLQGMGNYIGRADGVFSIHHEQLDAERMDSALQLTAGASKPATVYWESPYYSELFSFTNDSADAEKYYLSVYDAYGVMVMQAYDQNGAPILDFNPECFTVAAGETIYLMAISHGVNWMLEAEAEFSVEVLTTWEYVSGGVIYLIDGTEASVIGLTGDRFGYEIAETLFDDSFEQGYVNVTDFDENIIWELLWNTQIFYTDVWDNVAVLLDTFGFVVVNTNNISDIMGDADGDGICDINDVILLNAWITEAAGVRIAVENMPNCDLNSDGVYDVSDVVLLLDSVGIYQ